MVSGENYKDVGGLGRVDDKVLFLSPKKVWSYDTEKLARTDDLSVLPELWEMALVAGYQIVCTSGISAFDEHVVCGVRGDLSQT